MPTTSKTLNGAHEMKSKGVNACQHTITKNVMLGEWTYIGVGATDSTPFFTYTVGLKYKNLPEVIMTGVPPNISMQILKKYADAMVKNGKAFPNGGKVHRAANMPLVVLNIENSYKKKYFIQAYNHYRHWNFEAQQLIAPDASGRFPWEPDFSLALKDVQTIMGPIPNGVKIDYIL